MKIAIVYDSITGNTQKLAKVIFDACKGNEVFVYDEYNDDILKADLLFMGCYTYNNGLSDKMKRIYRKISNKEIFIFGTCGFENSKEYYKEILQNICDYIPASNKIVGCFFCPGRLPYLYLEKYKAELKAEPKSKKINLMLENFDMVLKHPNQEDFDKLESKVKFILNEG